MSKPPERQSFIWLEESRESLPIPVASVPKASFQDLVQGEKAILQWDAIIHAINVEAHALRELKRRTQ